MTSELDLGELRDHVLRKIGRNVVNFQKMEGMLRILNAQQDLSGSLTEIGTIAKEASKSVAKRPMGRLVEAFVRSAYSSVTPGAQADQASDETRVTFSLRIESDSEVSKERKKALSRLVAERNKLIHRWLAAFDPNSIESCKELAIALDEQHAKVWPEFEILKSFVLALREHHEEVRRYVDSGQFLLDLDRTRSDA